MNVVEKGMRQLGWNFVQDSPEEGNWIKCDQDGNPLAKLGSEIWYRDLKILQERRDKMITIAEIMARAHTTATKNGWWDPFGRDNPAERIALMHSELSEALEALRDPTVVDKHLPDWDPVGIELADTVIRIADYCENYNIDLGACIEAKLAYNETRPYKHGGKLF